MTIKDKIKKIEDELNLTKKYPDYFNKKLFRTATIIMLTLFIISFVTNDYKLNNVYAECNSEKECYNPFYLCSNIEIDYTNPFNQEQRPCLQQINYKTKDICQQGYCNIEMMQPHQIIGNKPNYYNKHFTTWILLLYLTTIGINHILYKRKIIK